MKLYFIRHGQTDFNIRKLPQGQEIDVPLNETGIKQAEDSVKSLSVDIDFIISSPLKRTTQTAEIINRTLQKDIEFSDDIKELRYGSLAGKPWAEIAQITGVSDAKEKDHNLTFDHTPYGGDSAEHLKGRVAKFVEEVREKYPAKTILVVTHGGVIDAMHILFPQKERKETGNAIVHTFIID
jgi:probable phosphoglycerate mutase